MPKWLAYEAIERFVDYGEWFVREVEKGPASGDWGELLSHAEVDARLESGWPKIVTDVDGIRELVPNFLAVDRGHRIQRSSI